MALLVDALAGRRVGLGTMRLNGSGVWGPPKDPVNARTVLRRAAELGVRLFDTADAYGPYTCEELVADALARVRDKVVIATKGGFVRTPDRGWHPDGRPEHLREACRASLRRLRTDAIDLYQLHTPDPAVPFAESVGALRQLQEEGLVRDVGVSNVTVAQLRTALEIAPVAAVQNRLNLEDRESTDVLRLCEERDIAFLAYTPVLYGDAGPAAQHVAELAGATPSQVALAWLLALSSVVVPIPGTRDVGHLEENTAAARLVLTSSQLDALAVSAATSPISPLEPTR